MTVEVKSELDSVIEELPTVYKHGEPTAVVVDIKLFQVEFNDPEERESFTYRPGQFAFVSAFGVGEAPFCLTSAPLRGPTVEFAVNKVGTVTNALHRLGEGDLVGVRGPFGNWFPMDDMKGKNIVLLGGGIGGAPIRPVLHTILDNRSDYGKLDILWAARLPSLLVFTEEFDDWRAAPNTELHLTVDQGDETWTDNVGLITELLENVAPSPKNAVTIRQIPGSPRNPWVLLPQRSGSIWELKWTGTSSPSGTCTQAQAERASMKPSTARLISRPRLTMVL